MHLGLMSPCLPCARRLPPIVAVVMQHCFVIGFSCVSGASQRRHCGDEDPLAEVNYRVQRAVRAETAAEAARQLAARLRSPRPVRPLARTLLPNRMIPALRSTDVQCNVVTSNI